MVSENEKIVEISIKNISDYKALSIIKKARQICSIYNSILLLKSRIDIAQIADCDGVSLNINEDISPHDAKKFLHDDKIISCLVSKNHNCDILNEINCDIILLKKEFISGLKLNLNGLDLIDYLIAKINKIIFFDEEFIKENKIDNNSKIKIFRV